MPSNPAAYLQAALPRGAQPVRGTPPGIPALRHEHGGASTPQHAPPMDALAAGRRGSAVTAPLDDDPPLATPVSVADPTPPVSPPARADATPVRGPASPTGGLPSEVDPGATPPELVPYEPSPGVSAGVDLPPPGRALLPFPSSPPPRSPSEPGAMPHLLDARSAPSAPRQSPPQPHRSAPGDSQGPHLLSSGAPCPPGPTPADPHASWVSTRESMPAVRGENMNAVSIADGRVPEKNKVLESEIMGIQRELDVAHRELDAQKSTSAATLRDAADREAKLTAELSQRSSQIEQSSGRRALLQEQLQAAKAEAAAQRERFLQEKDVLNDHFASMERELHKTLTQLKDAEARLSSTAEEKQVLRDWLDRGTRECDAAMQEHERTKALLAKTALDWEADHQGMAERLQHAEDELRRALEDRGVLASSLAATRDGVMGIASHLAAAVQMVGYISERCVALEAGLVAGVAVPPLGELPPPPDVAALPEDPLTTALVSAEKLCATSRDAWAGFQGFHTALGGALQQWVADRERLGTLPQQLAAAREEHDRLADSNDRLKLKLNELRRDVEKWRQLAAKAERAEPPAALTPDERQALMQARAVAAALYREKETLQRERDALRADTDDLQRSYQKAHSDNAVLADEVHRLRMEAALRGEPVDEFRY